MSISNDNSSNHQILRQLYEVKAIKKKDQKENSSC